MKKTMKSLSLSIKKLASSNWTLIALAFLILLAAATNVASAAIGLTVEVSRKGDLVMAEAVTVESDEVLDESWQWMIGEDCQVSAFDDAAETNQGWTATLNAQSGGKTYCFYVEDSQGRKAVGQTKIAYPIIRPQQKNDQLVARVANAEEENLIVDEDSWQWFRYDHIPDSRFGCQAEHVGLDDDALKAAAEAAEALQVEDSGEAVNDVYASQKDVYASGEGSIISLTAADEGLTYCVRVADSAGIFNSKHIQITEVMVADASAAAKPDKDSTDGDVAVAGSDSEDGRGVIGVDDASLAGEGIDAGSSNWPRVLGFTLLAVSLIAGIYMLVRASRLKASEEGE